ncbi:MAG: prepilin-type N-terminal cleavage/methylation domain-containing protein, partial [bacterium]|nr:prepilin-type N-terminal cleavage/methylation domain-containing protein [bacterium]
MKNKKGFTLVELLIVVVLIGLLLVIVIPAARNLTYNDSEKQYEQLSKFIDEASQLYAKNNEGVLASADCFLLDYSTL